jgi:hypothetical protein
MAFLQDLSKVKLKSVATEDKRDRSAANVGLAGKDELEDEAERWKYFFEAGCSSWFEAIKEHTFRSTFVDLFREEAAIIVEHYENRRRALAACESEGCCEQERNERLAKLFDEAFLALEPLRARLEPAVRAECEASAAGLAFVKLSTRSPKDSKRALRRAETAYNARLDAATKAGGEALDDNERWKILSEEVTRAGAVADAAGALELLLDSERVFEDLEYALRGPKDPSGSSTIYGLNLVARAWDPRLSLQSEWRGIAWGGQLTCLCQYFHPLFFSEVSDKVSVIESDCRKMFESPAVLKAVQSLGGHCIIDFAWLGPGDVIIVELNPFDGVCLGTFPASTGLFLWEKEEDKLIMKGEAPFETRIRTCVLPAKDLKAQCNPDW